MRRSRTRSAFMLPVEFVLRGVLDHDTPVFAVTSIETWWKRMGSKRYPDATELFITADAGGSDGARSRMWKLELQRLADRLDFPIHVSHFPPGTSKWNKGRAPTILLHLDQLARSTPAFVRGGSQPHWQYDQPSRPGRSRWPRSLQPDQQDGVGQRTSRARYKARRFSRRLELCDPPTQPAKLTV